MLMDMSSIFPEKSEPTGGIRIENAKDFVALVHILSMATRLTAKEIPTDNMENIIVYQFNKN